MTGGGIAIVNSSSGGSDGDGFDEWCERVGVARRDPGDDLAGTLRAVIAEHPRFIAVCGGDGTVRAAAAVIAEDVAMLPIPGGTFNHFAKSIGVGDLDAATAAVTSGRIRDVPLGDVNGEVFLNTCVVGWYPEMVRTRERLRARLPRPVALVAAFAKHARRAHRFDIELGGETRRIWSLWVGAGEFGLEPETLAERRREGVLDVRLMLAESRLPRLRLVIDLLLRRLDDSEHLDRTVTAESVTARLRIRPVTVALDAEVIELHSPLVLSPTTRHVRVLVPG